MRLDIETIVRSLCLDLGLDDFTKDTILRRFAAEGFSFFSKTLPSFAKQILHCIQIGRINCIDDPSSMVTHFALGKWDRIPLFLRVQLLKIFNKDGILRKSPDPSALYVIRQLCEYFYKLALKFSKTEVSNALESYLSTEADLASFEFDRHYVDRLRKRLETYYSVGKSLDEIFMEYDPRLTPGAFAGSQHLSKVWYRHFNEWKRTKLNWLKFPSALRGHEGLLRPFRGLKLSRWTDGAKIEYVSRRWTSELLFVPKDGRGPRTISKEPPETLRFQMIFFDYLVDSLERSTKGRIRFKDQELHRSLARQGSVDGTWATMDLKDASDRVPHHLVRYLFRNLPVGRLFDLRSEFCKLPNGEIIKLNKLSGMGSGFTFPVMSLLIHLTVCETLHEYFSGRVPYKVIMGWVYTFGDDLILPSSVAHLVESALLRVGLRLNSRKSFVQGPFRESCGGDYLCGVDVTPIRLKLGGAKLPTRRFLDKSKSIIVGGPVAVVELEAHCRHLVANGLTSLSEYFYNEIEKELGVVLPYISGNSDLLGRYTDNTIDVIRTSGGFNDGKKCTYIVPQSGKLPRPSAFSRDWDAPGTVIDKFRIDPYIALADALRPRSDGDELSAVAGEIGLPRTIKLKKVEPSTARCLGVTSKLSL